MLQIREIINKLYIILRFLKARREVPRLYAQASGVTKALLRALNSTLQLDVTPDEKIWINKIEAKGGVLVLTEKVLTNSTHMNRFFIDFYYDFKATRTLEQKVE